MEVLKAIESLTFLEDITESLDDCPEQLKIWREAYRVYQVKGSPNIRFKISSDWNGFWLAGAWYNNDIKIDGPDTLMHLLPEKAAVELAYNFDILNEISSWGRDRFILGKGLQ